MTKPFFPRRRFSAETPVWLVIVCSVERDLNGCWLWKRTRDRQGYGRTWSEGRSDGAHRVAYQAFVGDIPSGHQIDHLCRVTSCVNPGHLEPVTQLENMRRRYATQTHCKQGHEFTETNTYIRSNGMRDCRKCIAARAQRYRARKVVA